MSLTKQELDLLVTDLADRVAGLRVGKVFDLGPDRVALDLGRQGYLVLSGARQTGRIHLAHRVDKTGSCSAVCGLLRKHLRGSVIVDVFSWPKDRVVEIRFGRKVTLVLYVFGKGFALIDENRRVLGASHSCREQVGAVLSVAGAEGENGRGEERRTGSAVGGRSGKDRVRFSGQGMALHRQVAEAYRELEESLVREQARRQMAKLLRSQRRKLLRLKARLERELDRAEGADEAQRFADLLLSNQVTQKRGADQVLVKDWFHEGRECLVPIDPRFSLPENAERYYKRAKRDRRAALMALERLEATEARLAQLAELDEAVAEAETLSDVQVLERRLGSALGKTGVLDDRGTGPGKAGQRSESRDRGPGRVFRSATGLEIRVGGGAEENHRLTFHWARGRDMWFHVAGRPGPHVVVRARQDGSVDGETLLDAATLALFYVDKDRLAEGEVLYQFRKHLRPVKGAPGRVIAAGAKTIYLRIEDKRLSRLLSQRG